MKKSSRIDWIDAAKGIGLILVLIGHAPRDAMRSEYAVIDYLYLLIYKFHMPLFFFLAGCVYEHTKKKWLGTKWSRFVAAKARALLIPWLCFSLLVYAAVWLMRVLTPVFPPFGKIPFQYMPLTEYMMANLQAENPYCVHVWYIYVLFIIQTLVYLADRIASTIRGNAQESVKQTVLLMILSVIAYFVMPLSRHIMSCIFTYMLYYVFGMLCIGLVGSEKPAYKPLYLLGAGICFFSAWALDRGGLSNETMKSAVYLLLVFVGAPLMILLTVSLAGRFAQKKGICWMGVHSFDIYLLHQPLCAAAGSVMMMILPGGLVSYAAIMTICMALSILFPIAATEIGYRLGLGQIMRTCLGVSRIFGSKEN